MQHLIRYFPPIWAIFILVMSIINTGPIEDIGLDFFGFDKIAHLICYGILAGSTFIVLRRKKWIILLSVMAYGILIEWIQYSFFPSRFFEVYDIIANIIGAIIGIWVADKILK